MSISKSGKQKLGTKMERLIVYLLIVVGWGHLDSRGDSLSRHMYDLVLNHFSFIRFRCVRGWHRLIRVCLGLVLGQRIRWILI